MSQNQTKVYRPQGGEELIVADGGKISVESGGELELESGSILNAAPVADQNTSGGILLVHRVDVAGGTGDDIDVTLTHKTRVIDAHVVLGGAGTAGGTVTVKNGSDAITDAIDVSSGGNKDIVRAGEIDDSKQDIDAGGTLRVTFASDSDDFPADTQVYVHALRVA